MRNKQTFRITFAAIMISAAIAFEFIFKAIPFLDMPNSGSVSLTMLPLAIAAVICGPLYGVAAGVGFAIINCFVFDGGATPYSLILDYIIGFGAMGIVGIFRKQILEGKKLYFVLGFALSVMVRWIASGFSGVINAEVWGYNQEFLEEFFGAGNYSIAYTYLYSFIIYNLPYLAISAVLIIAIVLVGYKQMLRIETIEERFFADNDEAEETIDEAEIVNTDEDNEEKE